MRTRLLACLLLGGLAATTGCVNTATIPPNCPVTTDERALTRSDIRSRPGRSLLDMLRERVAGVEVRTVNGRPFLLIRGRSSLQTLTEPLVVVDGVELRDRGVRGLERVEATDVHAIEVIRDAAELSMYGIAGGAGVVRIATRRSGCD